MMLDSVIKSRMIPDFEVVHGLQEFKIPILLGDDPKVPGDCRETRKASWSGDGGITDVSVSNS